MTDQAKRLRGPSRHPGFSLLEVIIATGILAASTVLLLSLFSTGGRHADRAETLVLGKAAADAARDCAERSSSLFYVDTLEYLRRGGRIGATAALLGGALAVKPLLRIEDGRVAPLERVRTSARALARLEELAVTAAEELAGGLDPDVAVHLDVAVAHLANPDRAATLAEHLQERLGERLADARGAGDDRGVRRAARAGARPGTRRGARRGPRGVHSLTGGRPAPQDASMPDRGALRLPSVAPCDRDDPPSTARPSSDGSRCSCRPSRRSRPSGPSRQSRPSRLNRWSRQPDPRARPGRGPGPGADPPGCGTSPPSCTTAPGSTT